MLKFWKKKNTNIEPDNAPDTPADTVKEPDQAASPATTEATVPPEEPTTHPTTESINDAVRATTEEKQTQAHDTPAPRKRASWRARLAGSGFARGLTTLFKRNPKLDDDLIDELETILITADVGVTTSMNLTEELRERMHKREFADAQDLLKALRENLLERIGSIQSPFKPGNEKPTVMLVVGVNGVGKTTTIGKLTHRFKDQGHRVTLAAGDTFRAAAVEQLRTWGQRNNVPVISQGQGADSASVIYDAVDAAKAREMDILIADTAGRLHTQSGLMDELTKVIRVIKKISPDAPHEILMVIDGTTGQNAISQLKQFHESVGVTGLVVTKLDGTAKGGVIFALAEQFNIPIRFVGLGEQVEDLQPFDPEAFIDGLLPDQLGQSQDESTD